MNADLSVLVCMDVNENSSKLKKARKLNIRIVQLNDWLAELKDQPAPAPAIEPVDDLPLFSPDKEEPEEPQESKEPEQLMLGF